MATGPGRGSARWRSCATTRWAPTGWSPSRSTAALLSRPHGLLWLVAAGALSRSAAAGLGVLLPGARPDGLGRVLEGAGRPRVAVAAAAGVVIVGLGAGWPGLVAAAGVAAVA